MREGFPQEFEEKHCEVLPARNIRENAVIVTRSFGRNRNRMKYSRLYKMRGNRAWADKRGKSKARKERETLLKV